MKNAKKTALSFACILLITFSFTNCAEKSEKENTPVVIAPEQIVEVDKAKTMYDAYGKRRVPLIQRYEDSINRSKGYDKMKQQKMQKDEEIQTPKPFDVGRYVYYDYETIKQYMAYIEQEAKAKGVEISTLRLYFSNYAENMAPKNSKPKQNSIFLMPTLKQDNRTYGYFLNNQQQITLLSDDLSVSKTPFKHKMDAKDSKTKASFFPELSSTLPYISLQGDQSFILNEGGVRPPPYN